VSQLYRNRVHRFRVAILGVLTVGMVCASATAGIAGPGEGSFAANTDALRAQSGLPAYRVCGDLTELARSWATQMASSNSLAHNTSLPSQIANWRAEGENVGEGASEPSIQQALVNSPPHRANLLSSSFTEVGYGTAVSAGGTMYVDEVFRSPMSGTCAGGVTAALTPRVVEAPAQTSGYASSGERASRDSSALRSAPSTVPLTAAHPAVPVDHTTLAADRLSADLAHSVGERDVVAAVFTFHSLLAGAIR
jgi:hypothetical protein